MSDRITYTVDDRRAYITLNRPDKLNAIDDDMPGMLAGFVDDANEDPEVSVIVVRGEGRAFCAGYDLTLYAEQVPSRFTQDPVWDPITDYRQMKRNTDCFATLWRSLKPTICQIQGYALGGGSDIALSCDMVVMADDARIGYPPARVFGCPTTAMWVYRLGAEKAKHMLLTGDTIDGRTAAEWGLVGRSVPPGELGAAVQELAERMVGVPINQLAMQKLMINQAFDNMGLQGTQILATLFDGVSRHSPEGRWFKEFSEKHGFKEAVRWRDAGVRIPNGGGPAPEAAELGRPEPQ